jgi:hypothetical protein
MTTNTENATVTSDNSIIIRHDDRPPENITTAVVLENPNFYRDFKSHAVVNRDHSSYTAAMASKTYHRSQRNEIKSLGEKIDSLERALTRLISAAAIEKE